MGKEEFMMEAFKEAKLAFDEGEVPVGAIIVKDGQIVGRGHNRKEHTLDISSHAEIEAIRDAAKNLGKYYLIGCSIYVTLEPCLMCASAIAQSKISSLYYGADDLAEGAISSHHYIFDDPSIKNRPLVYKGFMAKESESLLKSFFEDKRD